jgi:CheY-like chemotaxis protein
MKILLVDDNAPLRAFAAEVLRDAGHQVVEHDDGLAALATADTTTAPFPFDLLITDFDLPNLDGLGLAERLRRRCSTLPVLLVSSHCGDHRLASRGDFYCLGKPFRRDQLLEALEGARRAAALPRRRAQEATTHRWPWSGHALGAVAVALALVAWLAGSLPHGSGPPPLPEPEKGQIRRSTAIQMITPQGVLAELPEVILWHAVEGATSYRLTFETVDGKVLFSTFSAAVGWPLADSLRGVLSPHVAYYWQVEAFSDLDGLLARSPKTRFRVIPQQPATTPDAPDTRSPNDSRSFP